MNPALATVNSNTVPGTVLEESVLSIKGKKLNSGSNPFTVTLKTADGQTIDLPTAVKNKGKAADILMPTIPDSVAGLVQVVLEISGGNVDASSPETFAVILTSRPEGIAADTTTVGTPPVLADTTDSGLSVAGPTGPQGPQGEQGEPGNEGPQGPTGPTPTSLPGGAIVGPVAQANQVVQASQNAITTLNNLISFGKTGVVTTAQGPLAAPEGFAGNLLGDVNGNVTGSSATFTGSLAGDVTGLMGSTTIADSVVTSKELNNAYSSTTGVLANGDSLQVAISKLDGNVKSNDSDISINANGIVANKAILDNATSLNTPDTLVLRDANGDFTAEVITADTGFVGNLTGNVSGNVSGSSATFTNALAGDVIGNQGSTVILDTVVTGKKLNNAYAPAAGVVANGNTLQTAVSKIDGNVIALTAVVGTPTAVNTGDQIVRRDGSGNFAANNITATTFSGNLSGLINTGSSAQPNIQSLSGLQNIGSTGVPITIYGPVSAQGLITGNLLGNVTGTLTGNVNGNLNGSAAEAIKLVNGATMLDITGGDDVILLTNGNATFTLPAITGELALVSYVDAADAALTALIGANANGAAAAIGANANGIAANTVAIGANSNGIIANTVAIGANANGIAANAADITAFTTGGGDLNGTALSAKELTDSTGAASVTVSGTDTVVITTAGDVDLTLPSANGTLALAATVATLSVSANGADLTGGEFSIDAAPVLYLSSGLATDELIALTNGAEGQRVTIVASSTFIVTDAASATNGAKNFKLTATTHTLDAGDSLELVFIGGTWYEVSFSNNL